MKKEIQILSSKYHGYLLGKLRFLYDMLNKSSGGIGMDEIEKKNHTQFPSSFALLNNSNGGSGEKKVVLNNHMIELRYYTLRIFVKFSAFVLYAVIVINIIPASMIYIATQLREPFVSWVANSIQSEGVVYNTLIAYGDIKTVYAVENFYKKRGSSVDLSRFQEIKETIKELK